VGDSATSPAVLLMASAPRPGHVLHELEPLLGPERCAELAAALISRAAAWAGEVAPGRVHVAHRPDGAGPELRSLVGSAAELFPQPGGGGHEGFSRQLADAAQRVFAAGPGPVLAIWPELPVWRAAHAAAALTDLGSGCDLAVGPMFDGGFYLVGLARPLAPAFGLSPDDWRSADAMAMAIGAAHQAGLELGLLRAERALRRPEDVRAVLADPLLDPELAAILAPAGVGR
jgi:glycosyltransferase A (GT-A) superfamily protein (DUF2064 family)